MITTTKERIENTDEITVTLVEELFIDNAFNGVTASDTLREVRQTAKDAERKMPRELYPSKTMVQDVPATGHKNRFARLNPIVFYAFIFVTIAGTVVYFMLNDSQSTSLSHSKKKTTDGRHPQVTDTKTLEGRLDEPFRQEEKSGTGQTTAEGVTALKPGAIKSSPKISSPKMTGSPGENTGIHLESSVKSAEYRADSRTLKGPENGSPGNITKDIEKENLRKREFSRYFSQAKNNYEIGDYKKALHNLRLAGKFGVSNEILMLEKRIKTAVSKKKKAAEKKRRQKQQEIKNAAYELALSQNTLPAYENYLDKFPSGRNADFIRSKINELKSKSSVKLRSFYKTLSASEVETMAKKFGFYDRYYNKERNFHNRYKSEIHHGEPVVIDFATGLMWHNKGTIERKTFVRAGQWIRYFNESNYAGYSDWRLPTLEEALSLMMDHKDINIGIHIDAYFERKQYEIWTGDFYDTGGIWVVNYYKGMTSFAPENDSLYVRAVRSMR